MTAKRKRIGLFLAALGLLAGCGGTISGQEQPGRRDDDDSVFGDGRLRMLPGE